MAFVVIPAVLKRGSRRSPCKSRELLKGNVFLPTQETLDARLKISSMTKNITVRSQLMVNLKAYVIVLLKCASVLHLQVYFSNIYATDESMVKIKHG